VTRTRTEFFAEQAQEAFQKGQDLLAAGDARAALRWIERARRFAPDDLTLRYALGIIWLRLGDRGRAAPLLEAVAHSLDVREAWFALASARSGLGQAGPAAAALQALLSRHVLPDDNGFASTAGDIARAAFYAGWCGRRRDGSIAIVAAAPVAGTLDGRRLQAARLAGLGRPAALPASGVLALSSGGRDLLGSPLDFAVFGRVEGLVAAADGGLVGWAWHPADPETPPRLTVRTAAGAKLLALTANDTSVLAPRPLARPRGFAVPAARLAAAGGLLHVAGPDGRDLTGSPLDPSPVFGPADAGRPPDTVAVARRAPRRAVAVVIPVHGGLRLTLDCLASVQATVPPGTAVVVVDDASPEPELAGALDALAGQRRIVLLRHQRNRGFPASANAGLRAARERPDRPDIVLLNSDTLVPPGWLEGLRAAVQASADIGTATPLSNDASILSYPDPGRSNPAPDAAGLQRLAALAARAGNGWVVDIPTAVGFCMYIRRECLDATGLFREDAFAQGYGEENDFCMRASRLGWRHVAVPSVFVAHVGGASFGGARDQLLARNMAVLERLHPGYRALVAEYKRADPLADARRRLDAARFRADAPGSGDAVLLVTHDSGGGVERVVRARCEALRAEGRRPVVLRPVRATGGGHLYLPGLCLVCDGTDRSTPGLRFALPAGLPALLRLLRTARPEAMEVHNLLGHHPAVMALPARLGIPYDLHVHDYAWFCPRITLVGPSRRYCGEPEAAASCEACIAEAGRNTDEEIGIGALRARSAAELAGARRVLAPSADAATRLRRRFPGLAVQVRPHTDDATLPPPSAAAAPDVLTRVCVVGGIGPEKGYDVLLACARDAAARALPLEFVVVGHTPDDAALLETGVAFVTGPYEEAAAVAEIRAQQAQFGFLPSVWPETWCFALGEAWQAGLDVAVFDIGAPAERVRRTGRGWVLPLGLPAQAINNALLAVRSRARH
jgi:GT2 family glycosyltransferase/glycosyltransferase involved in cell wall biosynthesis